MHTTCILSNWWSMSMHDWPFWIIVRLDFFYLQIWEWKQSYTNRDPKQENISYVNHCHKNFIYHKKIIIQKNYAQFDIHMYLLRFREHIHKAKTNCWSWGLQGCMVQKITYIHGCWKAKVYTFCPVSLDLMKRRMSKDLFTTSGSKYICY